VQVVQPVAVQPVVQQVVATAPVVAAAPVTYAAPQQVVYSAGEAGEAGR
jgi:hypothetical protein